MPELKRAIDRIASGEFTRGNPADARSLAARLLGDNEHFLVLEDFAAYAAAQDEVDALYVDQDAWSRKAVINTLSMGPFSSDRSIREYADGIWGIKPVL